MKPNVTVHCKNFDHCGSSNKATLEIDVPFEYNVIVLPRLSKKVLLHKRHAKTGIMHSNISISLTITILHYSPSKTEETGTLDY